MWALRRLSRRPSLRFCPKSRPQKKTASLDFSQQNSDSDVPLPPRARKRKRILSTSSLSGTSDKDDPFPTITPVVPSRARPKDDAGPSSSHRTPKPMHKPSRRVIDDDDSDDAGPEPPPPPPPPRARTPHRAPLQTTKYQGAPPPLPYTPRHHDSYAPFPPAVGHDSDAQMRFAQAAHYLSYLMSAAASLPPPTGYPPGYSPLPFPPQAPQWPPWMPVHRSQRSQRDQQSDLSSSDAGPSKFASSYHTPSHLHPYPFTFDPSYSSASLPPSSPPASSVHSSPIGRSPSLVTGRSKSRGRRVSFKLDGNDRPVLPSPPAMSGDEESEAERGVTSRRPQGHEADANDRPAVARKAKSKVSGRASTPAVKPDKGKARADLVEESGGPDSDRGRKRERGRTPGPPAHTERSASARSAGRKT